MTPIPPDAKTYDVKRETRRALWRLIGLWAAIVGFLFAPLFIAVACMAFGWPW